MEDREIIGGVAFSSIYALSAFGFGWAADRWIRRNIIAAGLVAWSAATAATSSAATAMENTNLVFLIGDPLDKGA